MAISSQGGAARKTITDPAIRPLVDGLVALFLIEGSVNAVHRRLAEVLNEGESPIYPNRLHALLSEDSSRAVNPQTVETLEVLLNRISQTSTTSNRDSKASAIRARVLKGWDATVTSSEATDAQSIVKLANTLGYPPAVVGALLLQGGRRTPQASSSAIGSFTTLTTRDRVMPDWSYQDDAYHAALRSLRSDLNRKTGLVIPTGGGKTRIGVRILLRVLADNVQPNAVVLWVTHRRFLGTQARREVQRAMTQGTPDLPQDAVKLLHERVIITMVSDLTRALDEYGDRVALVVIDEAHHAAAPVYAPFFARKPLRGLFLTATPIRTDGLGIGVDEIAYTITYRELFERGVLIEPRFEEPLVISGSGWHDATSLKDLADYVVERAQEEFVKTIIVASRVEQVAEMHEAIVAAIAELQRTGGSVLEPDDVGFVHGSGSASEARPEDYLDEFIALPRGILVTTGQMLGEGFDDPAVNAVVITYPTTSMVQLMQVAGRCLRFAPGKQQAFIVQVKESSLAYHYEQRWLYQEISDSLRPQIVDHRYTSKAQLQSHVEQVLTAYHIQDPHRQLVRKQLEINPVGQDFSLMLTGFPFEGSATQFDQEAEWNVVPVSEANRREFLSVFNGFSLANPPVKFASEFLRRHLAVDICPGSMWLGMRDMLTAMEYARRELDGIAYAGAPNRNYQPHKGTTWLTYVTFRYAPTLPQGLQDFIQDTVNSEVIAVQYTENVPYWHACVKTELPIGGALAFLLNAEQLAWLEQERGRVLTLLSGTPPHEAFARLEAWRTELPYCPLPLQLVLRFERFIAAEALQAHVYRIGLAGGGSE
ncbi:DEAD/DEAH box helicase [Hymenobacter sp. BT559]|uniref:DEAD/DEAH box helicase n=1 Tax=Hymenobacter sp. BT559 TaxID=2795729 RepID=UPI0018EE0778|nr:DEAD/DEAH box helicase family protein [Hymenobacter sp. BT559]MBJ6146310.1 DEAD/DEAH box helicase family protein [Hymenobacter sp. BT559]